MSRAVLRPPRTSGDELQLFMKFGTSLTPGQPKPSRPQGHWFQGCPEKHQNTGLRNPPNSSKPDRLKYIYPNFTGILKLAQVLKLAQNINIYFFHVQTDSHTRINNSDNREHMCHLTPQTNNSMLQAGLIVIKMKHNAFSVINGTMIEDGTISKQH